MRGAEKMIRDKNKLKAIRLLVFTCKPKREIAKECNITEQTLYNWLKDREFNEVLKLESKIYANFITSKMYKRFNEVLVKSLDVIDGALNSKDEKIRLKASIDFINAYPNFREYFKGVRGEVAGVIEQADGEAYFESGRREKALANEFLSSDLSELLSEEPEKEAEESADK